MEYISKQNSQRGYTNSWEIFKEIFNVFSHQGNSYQNYCGISSYSYPKWPISLKEMTDHANKNLERVNAHSLLMEVQTFAGTVENSEAMWQQLNKGESIYLQIQLLGHAWFEYAWPIRSCGPVGVGKALLEELCHYRSMHWDPLPSHVFDSVFLSAF